MIIPPPLKPGDRIGVIAASGPPNQEFSEIGIRFFENMGFLVHRGRHLYESCGYLAGTDVQRCQDLNEMLTDPGVRGIFFARGGYGVMRLLDTVDYPAVSRDPKFLLGMSDLTALSLALYTKCGLSTWAGPMPAGQMATGLDTVSEESLVSALSVPIHGRSLLPPNHDCRIVRSGGAAGTFLGGCLSLVTALLGTPYSPNFTDSILLLEDVSEPPYRLDRMLTHLKLAGVLNRAAAIVLGHFVGSDGADLSNIVEEIVIELTADHPIPILSKFPHGHALPNLTLPIGVAVELSSDPIRLVVQKD